ncbi:MAG TPA: Uma2 family endonuclease, partial [Nodosilinea sp.]|nr:Uma2 family endonuclease [Nodosilinea sp.]
GPDKLRRYAALGVAEVWFWEAGSLSVYRLHSDGYGQADESQLVQGIDLERLAQCAVIESRLQAVRAFRQGA